MEQYVIVDVGCIECGEYTKVVGVFGSEEAAYGTWIEYLAAVGANTERYEPSSGLKIFLNGESAVEAGLINEQGYFDGGQHSVELHKVVQWQPELATPESAADTASTQ